MNEQEQDAFAREADAIEESYASGEITAAEYRRWMKELRYDYECAVAEQARRAFEAGIWRFQ